MSNDFKNTLDAKAYWAERSGSYVETLDGPYHRHRMAMILALCEGFDLDGKLCLDAGCRKGRLYRCGKLRIHGDPLGSLLDRRHAL